MAQVGYFSWSSPTSSATIYMDTSRNGAQVTVTATVVCNLAYNSGYINYNGEINFNMWSNGASASANIKGYSDRWAANTARTRTRTCSMTFTSTASSIVVGYNMTIPDSRPSGAAFRIGDQYPTLGFPSYNAPSAPTWTNINPNPCSISSRPLITWGGASAGSLGRLYYDVEVRSTNSSSNWTSWLRIASAQGGTSYQETILKNMNVQGVRPFVGVRYQYRIRSSDGSYATSGWVNTPVLGVSFGTPTPPTTYTQTEISIKKDRKYWYFMVWCNRWNGNYNFLFIRL